MTDKELDDKLKQFESQYIEFIPYFVEAEQRRLSKSIWYLNPQDTEVNKVIYKYLSSLVNYTQVQQEQTDEYTV